MPEPDCPRTLEKSLATRKYRKYKVNTYLQYAQLALNQRKDISVAIMLVAQSIRTGVAEIANSHLPTRNT